MAKVVEIAPTSITCPVIEDVPAYVKEKGGIEQAVKSFEDTYKNLKFFENVVEQRKESMANKIAETESTLKYVNLLESKTDSSVETKFEISSGLYLPVKINKPKTVNLWIGANVMLEYSFEDAKTMLNENLSKARENISKLDIDTEHLTNEIKKMEALISKVVDAGVSMKATQ
ncbi:Prefoldin subunit 3 [Entamoeba marina]